MGWGDNVHVPMHTQAQLFHDQLPVGWGELMQRSEHI